MQDLAVLPSACCLDSLILCLRSQHCYEQCPLVVSKVLRLWMLDMVTLYTVSAILLRGVYVPSCHIWLFATPWTVAHHTAISVEFSRQESWSGLQFPSFSRDFPNPGIESTPLALAGGFFTSEPPEKPFTRRQWSIILRMYRIGWHRLGSGTGKGIYQYNESILSKLLLSLETKKTL